MNVIIAGTRTLFDYDLVAGVCDTVLANIAVTKMTNGDGPGTDQCGKRYARERGYPLELYPADWKTFGRSAGPKRNRQMALVADMLIAFWDGKSRGTLSMIREAKNRNLIIRVFRYDLNRFDLELQHR